MSIESHIERHLNQKVENIISISTGIFEAYKVKLKNGNYVFIKHQHNGNKQLINESTELVLLGKHIHTPKVLGCCEFCLILEWVDESFNNKKQSQMGSELANLHRNTSEYFGFEFDNKIGLTPQLNAVGKKADDWSEFFWEYRLLYQINLAHKNNLITYKEYIKSLSIQDNLKNLLDIEINPSLLHGDLWSGNTLSGKNNPYFIDTASYYGHREIDFALTFMFGGFSPEFYNEYNKHYPLDDGFDTRKHIYMLYHYLNHLNIFGISYHQNVMSCIHHIKSSN